MTRHGFRYANEVVGALVLLALGIFIVAVLQAGVLRQWFNPPLTLRVLLPKDGVSGLAAGAEVEILGTRAGEVRRIVIDPNQQMHAEVMLDEAMRAFVRRDSQAFIRKRFGVAGAAFLEVTRGTAEMLNWNFAVISAVSERAPTETMGALLDEVRTRVFPIVEETHRAISTVAAIVEKFNDPKGDLQLMIGDVRQLTQRIERGEGAVGRLLNDQTLIRELEVTVAEANRRLQQSEAILAELNATLAAATGATREAGKAAGEATQAVQNVNQASRTLPQLMQRVERTLAALQQTSGDLAKTTPLLPTIAKNVEQSTAGLPQLLTQTQQTTLELERLLNQLRTHWLLGGDKAPPPEAPRQPAVRVRP